MHFTGPSRDGRFTLRWQHDVINPPTSLVLPHTVHTRGMRCTANFKIRQSALLGALPFYVSSNGLTKLYWIRMQPSFVQVTFSANKWSTWGLSSFKFRSSLSAFLMPLSKVIYHYLNTYFTTNVSAHSFSCLSENLPL